MIAIWEIPAAQHVVVGLSHAGKQEMQSYDEKRSPLARNEVLMAGKSLMILKQVRCYLNHPAQAG